MGAKETEFLALYLKAGWPGGLTAENISSGFCMSKKETFMVEIHLDLNSAHYSSYLIVTETQGLRKCFSEPLMMQVTPVHPLTSANNHFSCHDSMSCKLGRLSWAALFLFSPEITPESVCIWDWLGMGSGDLIHRLGGGCSCQQGCLGFPQDLCQSLVWACWFSMVWWFQCLKGVSFTN